jgi:hypothetical protein
MQDYWNDPPEEYEPPECCDSYMGCTPEGVLFCEQCGKRIEPDPGDMCSVLEAEMELYWEEEERYHSRAFEEHSKCPHGNEWHDCSHCDFLSDIAYTASKERR